MAKAGGNCTRCNGKGTVAGTVIYYGVAGGCFACRCTGSAKVQQEVLEAAQRAKAERKARDEWNTKITARAKPVDDPKLASVIRSNYQGVFKTADLARTVRLDEKIVFGQLAFDLGYGMIGIHFEDGKPVGWEASEVFM